MLNPAGGDRVPDLVGDGGVEDAEGALGVFAGGHG